PATALHDASANPTADATGRRPPSCRRACCRTESLGDPALHDMSADVGTVRERLRALGDSIEIGGVRLGEHVSAGKLLRRRLVLAAAALGNQRDFEQALRYAVLVELIHTGALLHDDVMDRCTLRRGQATVW